VRERSLKAEEKLSRKEHGGPSARIRSTLPPQKTRATGPTVTTGRRQKQRAYKKKEKAVAGSAAIRGKKTSRETGAPNYLIGNQRAELLEKERKTDSSRVHGNKKD